MFSIQCRWFLCILRLLLFIPEILSFGNIAYAKLAWLQSTPYNPRYDGNLESFVTSQYNAIRGLDTRESEPQICNSLATLMLAAVRRIFVALSDLTLIKVMETVRRFEAIPEGRMNEGLMNEGRIFRGKDLTSYFEGNLARQPE